MTPIERKLYEALWASVPDDVYCENIIDTKAVNETSGGLVFLERDVPLLTYVADFVLTTNSGSRLVVECDGHDFHDRTKQQAAYDRARDRELLALGIRTMRFTGSEIHHSAERCAREVWAVVALMLREEDVEIDSYHRAFEAGRRSVLDPRPPRGDL